MAQKLGRLLALAAALSACAAPQPTGAPVRVEFLTREGCPASADMRAHLDAALQMSGDPRRVLVVDVDALPIDDDRTGYGTPTILIDGEDLFGVPRPGPAAPT